MSDLVGYLEDRFSHNEAQMRLGHRFVVDNKGFQTIHGHPFNTFKGFDC